MNWRIISFAPLHCAEGVMAQRLPSVCSLRLLSSWVGAGFANRDLTSVTVTKACVDFVVSPVFQGLRFH